MLKKNIITVTSPLMPNLDEFHELLKVVWNKKWITNNGDFHQQLEAALAEYLKVPYISLFINGTLPLLTALLTLRITGEIITRPIASSPLPTVSGGMVVVQFSSTSRKKPAVLPPTR